MLPGERRLRRLVAAALPFSFGYAHRWPQRWVQALTWIKGSSRPALIGGADPKGENEVSSARQKAPATRKRSAISQRHGLA
jgi:hypothetical protein